MLRRLGGHSGAGRADLLRAVYDAIVDRTEDFASVIAPEMGKPWTDAMGEVDYGAGFLRWFSEAATRLHMAGRFDMEPGGQYRLAVSKPQCSLSRRRPGRSRRPWPPAARRSSKPAEQKPLTAMLPAQVPDEVVVPAGILNAVTTSNAPEVIGAIMEDPRRHRISFTGSHSGG